MDSIRTFIAIPLAPAVTKRAADLIRRLQVADAKVNWVEREQMHMTLKFLGDVKNTEIHAVCRLVAQVTAKFAPFSFTSQSAGAFPKIDRPRTVWLGCAESAPLIDLQKNLDEGLYRELGFPGESRRFHPHVTLGRVRHGGPAQDALAQMLKQGADFQAGETQVEEVIIFASYLDRSGPRYEVLGRAPLSE